MAIRGLDLSGLNNAFQNLAQANALVAQREMAERARQEQEAERQRIRDEEWQRAREARAEQKKAERRAVKAQNMQTIGALAGLAVGAAAPPVGAATGAAVGSALGGLMAGQAPNASTVMAGAQAYEGVSRYNEAKDLNRKNNAIIAQNIQRNFEASNPEGKVDFSDIPVDLPSNEFQARIFERTGGRYHSNMDEKTGAYMQTDMLTGKRDVLIGPNDFAKANKTGKSDVDNYDLYKIDPKTGNEALAIAGKGLDIIQKHIESNKDSSFFYRKSGSYTPKRETKKSSYIFTEDGVIQTFKNDAELNSMTAELRKAGKKFKVSSKLEFDSDFKSVSPDSMDALKQFSVDLERINSNEDYSPKQKLTETNKIHSSFVSSHIGDSVLDTPSYKEFSKILTERRSALAKEINKDDSLNDDLLELQRLGYKWSTSPDQFTGADRGKAQAIYTKLTRPTGRPSMDGTTMAKTYDYTRADLASFAPEGMYGATMDEAKEFLLDSTKSAEDPSRAVLEGVKPSTGPEQKNASDLLMAVDAWSGMNQSIARLVEQREKREGGGRSKAALHKQIADRAAVFADSFEWGRDFSNWLSEKGFTTEEVSEFKAAANNYILSAQAIIKGVPSDFDVKNFIKTVPKLSNDDVYNNELMRLVGDSMRYRVESAIVDARKNNRNIPHNLQKAAQKLGLDYEKITASYQPEGLKAKNYSYFLDKYKVKTEEQEYGLPGGSKLRNR